MGIRKWPYFPAEVPFMIMISCLFFLFDLSEVIKGRSGLREQFRSTLAGSGKFPTWKTKLERKDFLTALLQLHVGLLWCARLACAENLRSCLILVMTFLCTNLGESFKTGKLSPGSLRHLTMVPPGRFLKVNMLTASQLSRPTFCRPQPRYYLVQALTAVIATAAAAAICSVTFLTLRAALLLTLG